MIALPRTNDLMRSSTDIASWVMLAVAISLCACQRAEPRTASARESNPSHSSTTPARWADSDSDGLPDGAELHSYNDRENFRQWFTRIAEQQFYSASEEWKPEQRDCAGLVRFAWRETLRPHDRNWFRKMGVAFEPPAPDVRAYTLNEGPLGEKIFRTDFGSFQETDLGGGKFSEFADARTLKDFNAEFVGRDRRTARAGDLIFFHQPWVQKYPYHVMIFVGLPGESSEGANDWVVYHTGASTNDAGEVRKVRLATLDSHPDPRWRPVARNRNFLGFYRLKILQ